KNGNLSPPQLLHLPIRTGGPINCGRSVGPLACAALPPGQNPGDEQREKNAAEKCHGSNDDDWLVGRGRRNRRRDWDSLFQIPSQEVLVIRQRQLENDSEGSSASKPGCGELEYAVLLGNSFRFLLCERDGEFCVLDGLIRIEVRDEYGQPMRTGEHA